MRKAYSKDTTSVLWVMLPPTAADLVSFWAVAIVFCKLVRFVKTDLLARGTYQ